MVASICKEILRPFFKILGLVLPKVNLKQKCSKRFLKFNLTVPVNPLAFLKPSGLPNLSHLSIQDRNIPIINFITSSHFTSFHLTSRLFNSCHFILLLFPSLDFILFYFVLSCLILSYFLSHFAETHASKVYRFILNMILGRIIHRNTNVEVVPVCFDYSSDEDIPLFLSERRYYSLPSSIDKMCLSLIGVNSRSVASLSEYKINNTNEISYAVTKLKKAVENVRRNHYGNTKRIMVSHF